MAAGDGNFALACAREGASVVACDLAPRMVELGRARTEAEGYDVEWVEADAEALPFEDARFDCAGSVFGAFLAPQPEVVARELFRVVRPGNTVGLTAWAADSFIADCSAGAALPAPARGRAAARGVGRRGRPCARGSTGSRRTWRSSGARSPGPADSPEALEAELADSAPAYAAAREALPPEQLRGAAPDTLELLRELNTADDGTCGIDADYLVIVARKRG